MCVSFALLCLGRGLSEVAARDARGVVMKRLWAGAARSRHE
jgi:hypothetical protein